MMLTSSWGKAPALMHEGMSTGKVTFSMLLATIFIEKEYWRTTVLIDRHMQL